MESQIEHFWNWLIEKKEQGFPAKANFQAKMLKFPSLFRLFV